MAPAPNAEALRADLAKLVSHGLASNDTADRVAYARDLWPRQQLRTRMGEAAIAPPAVVVWPSSVEEVAAVVGFAAERGIEIVPYGAGSGVCGGILPVPTAIVMDMKRMRALRSVDATRLIADAQAGIIGQHLEDDLGAQGYTLGHFPSSIGCSSLGGWIAGRSAGQTSGRYGKIEDMVLELTCVDGRGRVLRASRDGENSALLPLIIGSEGILSVVTDARLRVAPAPPCRRFSSWNFAGTAEGLDAIRHVYQAGLRPAVARLYDPFDSMLAKQGGVKGANDEPKPTKKRKKKKKNDDSSWLGPGFGAKLLMRALRRPGLLNEIIDQVPDRAMGGATLVFVWEDDPAIADAELAELKRICSGLGGKDTGEGPARRWLAHRHSVSYRQSAIFASGGFVDTMEVTATWSRMYPMYLAVRDALSPHVFVMAHFSHAYPDGASIYFSFAGSAPSDEAALSTYDRAWKSALAAVVDAGGSLSHHHGVGRSKAPAMRREQGVAIDVVRELKKQLDPACILNPGALVPLTDS